MQNEFDLCVKTAEAEAKRFLARIAAWKKRMPVYRTYYSTVLVRYPTTYVRTTVLAPRPGITVYQSRNAYSPSRAPYQAQARPGQGTGTLRPPSASQAPQKPSYQPTQRPTSYQAPAPAARPIYQPQSRPSFQSSSRSSSSSFGGGRRR